MPNLTASIPHRLGRLEAKRRIEHGLSELRRQPDALLATLKESWTGDRLDFVLMAVGQTISGHLTVDDGMVYLEVALPWLLKLVAGPVFRRMETDVQKLLGAPTPEARTP